MSYLCGVSGHKTISQSVVYAMQVVSFVAVQVCSAELTVCGCLLVVERRSLAGKGVLNIHR